MFIGLQSVWGVNTCDVFASNYNTKCLKFYSRWWCPGTSGIDAFLYGWSGDFNWWVPPTRLVAQVISKSLKEKAMGTLIIPYWKSAPFWPNIYDQQGFKSFITDYRIMSANILKKEKGNNGIFGKKDSKFSMLVAKIQF